MKMTIPAADQLVGDLQAKCYECDRYKRALETIAAGSGDAVEIAKEALEHRG